jgi:hypothetical protein
LGNRFEAYSFWGNDNRIVEIYGGNNFGHNFEIFFGIILKNNKFI